MKTKRGILAVSTVVVASAAMFASALPANAAAINLRIGTIHPLTGGNADYGIGLTSAAEFAAETMTKAMKAAKIAGSCKIVASEDDQATPALAVEAATKLVKSNKVHAIVGPLTSGSTLAAAQSVTVPNKVVMIATAASNPDITNFKDNDLLFRTYPSDAFQAKVIVKALQNSIGKSGTINIGARNDAFGTALANVVTNEWVRGGGNVGQKVLWNPEAATFDSEAKLLTDKTPDAWVIVDFPDTFAKVGPALKRTGKWDTTKTFMTEAFNNEATIKNVIGVDIMAGVRGTSAKSIGLQPDAWKAARKAAKPNTKETFVDGSAYDATTLLCLAALHAKSTKAADLSKSLRAVSGANGGKNIPWNKRAALVKAAAAGQNFTYQGAWTTAKFDKNGDTVGALFQVFSVGADGKISSDPKNDIRF
jgi:ABC-type branched-subunit amino acid transport system substrate-binding protein